jgi:hypothetical protein
MNSRQQRHEVRLCGLRGCLLARMPEICAAPRTGVTPPLRSGGGAGGGGYLPPHERLRTGPEPRASDRDPKGGDPQQYRGAPFAQRQ